MKNPLHSRGGILLGVSLLALFFVTYLCAGCSPKVQQDLMVMDPETAAYKRGFEKGMRECASTFVDLSDALKRCKEGRP